MKWLKNRKYWRICISNWLLKSLEESNQIFEVNYSRKQQVIFSFKAKSIEKCNIFWNIIEKSVREKNISKTKEPFVKSVVYTTLTRCLARCGLAFRILLELEKHSMHINRFLKTLIPYLLNLKLFFLFVRYRVQYTGIAYNYFRIILWFWDLWECFLFCIPLIVHFIYLNFQINTKILKL